MTYTVETTTENEMELVEADAMARRVWWIDDYVSDEFGWDFGQGSGTTVPITGKLLAEAVEAAGVASVELWVETPDADDEFVEVDVDAESIDGTFAFTATEGAGTYRFYTIAVTDDGTREEAPADADTQTVYYAAGADTTAPISEASAKRASNGKPFMVRYLAEDEEGGSGLATVDLYARVPGAGGYALVDTDAGAAINNKFRYTPEAGDGVYRFYTVATDNAGNVEAAPAQADARVRVDSTPPRVTGVKVGPKPFDISRDKALEVKARSSEKGKVVVRIVDRDDRVVQKLGTKVRKGKLVETWKGRT